MSSLAVEGGGEARLTSLLRWLDLPLLALALPVFVLGDLPMLGYAGLAAAWTFTRGLQLLASRNTVRALARGDRRSAMGVHAATMLARIWILAITVLVVGLSEREAGLAAAVLAAVLVTAYLGGNALAQLISGEESR